MSNTSKPKSLFICEPYAYENAYGAEEKEAIAEKTDIIADRQYNTVVSTDPELLKEVEILFTSWGAPKVDEDFLSKAPKLKAVFHAAGSIKHIASSEAFWERNISITSAAHANSIPVAEFCLAQILLATKRFWFFTNMTQLDATYPNQKDYIVPGAYKSKVGIITLGAISKILVDLLKPFDMEVLVFSRSLTEEKAAEMGVTKASIDEILKTCDVISLHTPLLPSTQKMLGGEHFKKMKENATFINTARGAVTDEKALIEVAKSRPDLTFLLDVTDPEPPVDNSEVLTTRNVIVSPHNAGSLNRECERMGNLIVSELDRYLAGQPLLHAIDKSTFDKTA